MTQVIANNLNSMFRYKEKIFIVLVCAIFISACAYIFLVKNAIVNVIEREKITKQIREKSTVVSNFEAKYFSAKNNINIELAHLKGYKDAEVTSYISRKSLTAFASHNEL